jgi:hypothetical protein
MEDNGLSKSQPHGRKAVIPRIGFLFTHDQSHQVAHSLPIALSLIASGQAQVSLITTNSAITNTIKKMAGDALSRTQLIELAPTSLFSRGVTSLLDRLVPVRKLAVYRDHLDLFKRFDVLVVSEKSSLLLKSHYGLDQLKLVHTRHGAGDRAIGFNKQSADFDLVLVSGRKIRDRLIAETGVSPEKIAITGYCKFDLFATDVAATALFPHQRPTILYNPHPSPRLSSWYRWGHQILEAFADQDRYNLIFAPHIMLFQRRWTVTLDPPAIARMNRPDPRYATLPHMHIDLGSAASTDMTYTQAADLYLGDVSSQTYEFLVRPRPCLFLNAHGVDWRDDESYKHWRAGPVIDSVDDIVASVTEAFESFEAYRPVQMELLDETFSVTDVPAARRGAAAILDLFRA